MNNQQAVLAWVNGHAGHSNHLSSDGENLYSYALLIGFTQPNGFKYVYDYTAQGHAFRSMATSHHVGLARGNAGVVLLAVTSLR